MYYSIPQQISEARHIARAAEQQIKNSTGMVVRLMLCPEYHRTKSPEELLQVVAAALGMEVKDYATKCRTRPYVDLRFIAANLLCSHFPAITLLQITVFFGRQHHTSILNGLERVRALIAAGDPRFMAKYETAQAAVNRWVRKESTGKVTINLPARKKVAV
ncbi:MAG: hypothetical protein H7257_01005 [Taibaiella sp.]|nr:hypothetical protein [Taibaiella sp.]